MFAYYLTDYCFLFLLLLHIMWRVSLQCNKMTSHRDYRFLSSVLFGISPSVGSIYYGQYVAHKVRRRSEREKPFLVFLESINREMQCIAVVDQIAPRHSVLLVALKTMCYTQPQYIRMRIALYSYIRTKSEQTTK